MTRTFTREDRKALLASIPWVRRLTKAKPCDGHRSGMPLKAVYSMGGKPPIGKDSWKCKKLAYWRFTAKRNSWARTGNYCFSHLVALGLYGDDLEAERFEAWLKGMGIK